MNNINFTNCSEIDLNMIKNLDELSTVDRTILLQFFYHEMKKLFVTKLYAHVFLRIHQNYAKESRYGAIRFERLMKKFTHQLHLLLVLKQCVWYYFECHRIFQALLDIAIKQK